MSDRYDIKAWRMSRNDKAYTVRVGSAYVDQKGVTRLEFDAMPIPDKDGRVTAFLEVQKPRDEQPAQAPARTGRMSSPPSAGLDDAITF